MPGRLRSRSGEILLAAALVWLAGCTSPQVPDGRRYDVQGVVRAVEVGERATRLRIEHEAIPQFVDIDGEVVGMDAMTMTMTVWSGVDLPADLKDGDRVRFQLDVEWTRTPSALIVALEVLGPSDPGV